jgi:predicted dehydrogenase
VVYIACPPNYHEEHALAAFAANKAVYCEKPLGVDVAQSESLAAQAQASGLPNIVNFSLASAAATRELEMQLANGTLGEVWGVDVRIHFSQWPRAWQMAAADWLSYRNEGGFTREVLSHWVYLTERLIGCVELESCQVRYPRGNLAETHLQATLLAEGVPVSIAASSGGVGPDQVEYTVWGTQASSRVVDWNELFTSNGGPWAPALADIADPREKGYELQLANAAAATAGKPHSMPTFADALSVQSIIEAMLE